MDAFDFKKYLFYALKIIRANTIVLWCLGFIGLCSAAALLLRDTGLYGPLNALTMALSITATPVFYGIYLELIEDTYSSIPQIARTYILNYIWLLVRMYLPVIIVATIPLLMAPGVLGSGFFEITLICSSLVYIYVIPTYYLFGQQRGAIASGVSFLFRNLFKSTPVIFTVLILETTMLLMQLGKNSYSGQGTIYFAILDLFIYLIASVIDLAVFIILIYVLKNSREEGDKKGID